MQNGISLLPTHHHTRGGKRGGGNKPGGKEHLFSKEGEGGDHKRCSPNQIAGKNNNKNTQKSWQRLPAPLLHGLGLWLSPPWEPYKVMASQIVSDGGLTGGMALRELFRRSYFIIKLAWLVNCCIIIPL